MLKVKEMNGTQKIAYKNIKACFNYEVGGWYNCLQDGYEEDIPETIEQAKEIIYDGSLNCTYGEGSCSMRAKDEVRFAGKEFINEVIDALFEKDEDIKEIAEVKGWFKKEEETMSGTLEIKEVKDELTGEVAEVEVKETEDGFEFEEKAPEVTMVEAYPVEEDTTATTMTVKVEKLNGPATYAAKEVKIGWKKVVVITTDGEDIVFPRKSFYMRANGRDTYLFTKVEIDGEEIPTRFYEDEDFRGVYRKSNYKVTREAL